MRRRRNCATRKPGSGAGRRRSTVRLVQRDSRPSCAHPRHRRTTRVRVRTPPTMCCALLRPLLRLWHWHGQRLPRRGAPPWHSRHPQSIVQRQHPPRGSVVRRRRARGVPRAALPMARRRGRPIPPHCPHCRRPRAPKSAFCQRVRLWRLRRPRQLSRRRHGRWGTSASATGERKPTRRAQLRCGDCLVLIWLGGHLASVLGESLPRAPMAVLSISEQSQLLQRALATVLDQSARRQLLHRVLRRTAAAPGSSVSMGHADSTP